MDEYTTLRQHLEAAGVVLPTDPDQAAAVAEFLAARNITIAYTPQDAADTKAALAEIPDHVGGAVGNRYIGNRGAHTWVDALRDNPDNAR